MRFRIPNPQQDIAQPQSDFPISDYPIYPTLRIGTLPLKKIEYDKTTDALYVYAGAGSRKVHKTLKLNNRVLFDVDKKGKIIGIEVLDASKPWKMSVKKSSYKKQFVPV